MAKAAPAKQFIGAPGADGHCNCNMCPYMALNSLEKLYLCLRDLEPRIEVPEAVRVRALLPLDRMLAITSGAPTDLTPAAGRDAWAGD
jgi:quinolinate synthase